MNENVKSQGSVWFSPSLKSHLSPGIPFIRLRGRVSNQGGGPRTAVMRRWRRSLGLIIAVSTWYT